MRNTDLTSGVCGEYKYQVLSGGRRYLTADKRVALRVKKERGIGTISKLKVPVKRTSRSDGDVRSF
jgi:hypothetical protein